MIRHDVDLTGSNTLCLHSRARAVCEADSVETLRLGLAFAQQQGLPWWLLGEGSNVVLARDLHGLVIRPRLRGIRVLEQDSDSVLIEAAAGENWHALVVWALQHGHYGLENLALIPGTVGAAPVQNIGAYGIELSAFTEGVAILYEDGREGELTAAQCGFAYRDSVFKQALRGQVIITSVRLRLLREPRLQLSYPALRQALQGQTATPQSVFEAVCAVRRARLPDPLIHPNAGSFFKNPRLIAQQLGELQQRFPTMPSFADDDTHRKVPAAWLIEQCGWRGRCLGPVGMHESHALVLVNWGNADATDVLALADAVRSDVHQRFGIMLELEPRIYPEPVA